MRFRPKFNKWAALGVILYSVFSCGYASADFTGRYQGVVKVDEESDEACALDISLIETADALHIRELGQVRCANGDSLAFTAIKLTKKPSRRGFHLVKDRTWCGDIEDDLMLTAKYPSFGNIQGTSLLLMSEPEDEFFVQIDGDGQDRQGKTKRLTVRGFVTRSK